MSEPGSEEVLSPDAGGSGPPPLFAARRAAVECALRELLDGSGAEGALARVLPYAVLGGGKRLRPCLSLVAGQLVDGSGGRALPLAAALELFHAFTLVHDDLPCMDNDVVRRGRPTCHVAFGEATALLGGDGLVLLAFEALGRVPCDPELAPALRLELVRRLARAGGPGGVIGGQAQELAVVASCATATPGALVGEVGDPSRSPSVLETVHRAKTARLFELAAGGAALACGAPGDVERALQEYGLALGLLFQLTDDRLDADPAALDGAERAVNLAVQLGPQATARRARQLAAQSSAALAGATAGIAAGHPLGAAQVAARDALDALPSFILGRSH